MLVLLLLLRAPRMLPGTSLARLDKFISSTKCIHIYIQRNKTFICLFPME
ncbi:hypothetical protein LOK49_LG11G01862 [Camellia lanceoleosa]|uniref:Uncharacterized protein n=1 Tax=Camellia lanceoleosa TaxID=1840588 RepID=A0ACC0G1L8_9ERIC|nr:hypothetical protein LOK49_LG11G01862 [Camellia lanceoleosa]